MECCNGMKTNRGCCRDETKMVRCAVTALEKMKDMFGTAIGNLADPPSKPGTAASGCVMDNKCQFQGCPFRGTGIRPNVLQTFCNASNEKPTTNGRSDRDAMRLLPGEVGLRGDRATFHLGQGASQPVPLAKDGRPTGAVYYNMHPGVAPPAAMAGKGFNKHQQFQPLPQPQRKHVMQVLPALPTSSDPAVGPVTGLPIHANEHVFVLRLGKRYDEPDEKARLQIEVRLPKQSSPPQTEAHTQFLTADMPQLAVDGSTKKNKGLSKKAGGKKSAKKGKK